jgi:SAM-dependent methyltransferase
LEHVLYPDQVIQEIYRILRHEGRFILSIPNERLINQAKKWVSPLLSLWNRIRPGEYQVAERMEDEWHLHEFNLPMIQKYLYPFFQAEEIYSIPYRFLPLRFVIHAIKKA